MHSIRSGVLDYQDCFVRLQSSAGACHSDNHHSRRVLCASAAAPKMQTIFLSQSTNLKRIGTTSHYNVRAHIIQGSLKPRSRASSACSVRKVPRAFTIQNPSAVPGSIKSLQKVQTVLCRTSHEHSQAETKRTLMPGSILIFTERLEI